MQCEASETYKNYQQVRVSRTAKVSESHKRCQQLKDGVPEGATGTAGAVPQDCQYDTVAIAVQKAAKFAGYFSQPKSSIFKTTRHRSANDARRSPTQDLPSTELSPNHVWLALQLGLAVHHLRSRMICVLIFHVCKALHMDHRVRNTLDCSLGSVWSV